MKVLVISHNIFSKSSNMGKTLMSYFKDWDSDDLAQLYVHTEIPTDDICRNYFRITDKEMIKSIFTRKSGRIFSKGDINSTVVQARTDTGKTAQLYQKARKRTPFIYFARNLWWCLGKWKTKKLLNWIDEFNPDIIFLASGDYAFIYKMALKLAQYKKIPLVVSCMDDYYFHNLNEHRVGGKFVHKSFMRQVKKTMNYASCIYPICDKMSKRYETFFKKPCYTLHTGATIEKPLRFTKTNEISYLGNLGYDRYKQLITIGRYLKKIQCENKPEYIDVYSGETRPEVLKDLTEENGIKFHGMVSAEQVLEITGKSLAVIHTESFDENIQKRVKYSVSTKIADALASGTCLLAYGPKGIASISYLQENDVAYCITSESELEKGLLDLIEHADERNRIVNKALELARKNHNTEVNGAMLKETMEKVCGKCESFTSKLYL